MSRLHSQIEPDGRVKLPRQVMNELELKTGNELEFRVLDGSVQILPTAHERVRRVQEKMKKYIKPGVSVVDELIADRRLEAENE